ELTTVVQLNTTGARTFNEFRVAWQRGRVTRSQQPGQALFPAVRVDFTDGTGLQLGSDPLAHANGLDQDGVEVTDDFTWSAGTHTLTAGTHNEFFRFNSLFIPNLDGSYRFSSIDNLRAGFAQAFSRTFSNTSDPRQAAAFSVRQLGLYLGD